MLAFIMPTRDRQAELDRTLDAVGRLGLGPSEAEVVIADNASRESPRAPGTLANGLKVTLLRRGSNEGAAARTAAALEVDASRKWLVMLDDDSAPVESGSSLIELLESQPSGVGAVMADIHLPLQGKRESGGLPEVPVGCGVAYRREAYLHAGGYDPLFNYYAEEYDLSAKLLLAGWRVAFEPTWRVEHRKVETGRDMNVILGRLVRNNGWVMARYAPASVRGRMLDETIERYGRIAKKEGAVEGYRRGLIELQRTLDSQPRDEMDEPTWDRFTGLAAAREAIGWALAERAFESASIVSPGKNEWAVRRALEEAGVEVHEGVAGRGDVLVVGTMSPGPMLDARKMLEPLGRRVVLPWIGASRLIPSFERPEVHAVKRRSRSGAA
ncbi:MAG: glycosyltransferase [Phycisphaeraceae bacterium]|nr:MAG: glycosyltransferase [Phycisphaeraceae bacterium]